MRISRGTWITPWLSILTPPPRTPWSARSAEPAVGTGTDDQGCGRSRARLHGRTGVVAHMAPMMDRPRPEFTTPLGSAVLGARINAGASQWLQGGKMPGRAPTSQNRSVGQMRGMVGAQVADGRSVLWAERSNVSLGRYIPTGWARWNWCGCWRGEIGPFLGPHRSFRRFRRGFDDFPQIPPTD